LVYFFVKDECFVQCEIDPGPPSVLTLVTPSGTIRNEVHGSLALVEAWEGLCLKLAHEGYRGPFGRDPRA
jgi:hypothetical protein